MSTPLGVLDLVPISAGSSPAEALRNTVDLAQRAEALGYHRYWLAEHHLNPGVAGTSPAVVLALTAGATSTIRIGSGAVQMGHRSALSTVEEFGLLDAVYPGRIDLGLGRSSGRPPEAAELPPQPVPVIDGYTPNGLRIPKQFSYKHLVGSPRVALQKTLLPASGGPAADYAQQVGDILALLAGTYRSAEGEEAHVVPGEGAGVELWIMGTSGGQSAEVAGRHGLRFAASYHVAPATVLDAVAAYRHAFRPSAELAHPYLAVSADVVVADTDEAARELAAGYGLWVRSIRRADGAIPFPTPEQARAYCWTEDDWELVVDRVETQLVGSPERVAARLEQLQEATGADELIVTTITHGHADRVRSFELLAHEWQARQAGRR